MLDYYKCPNGDEVTCGHEGLVCIEVDDQIEFLERHRGKRFYSGALDEACLYAGDEGIQLEEREYFLEEGGVRARNLRRYSNVVEGENVMEIENFGRIHIFAVCEGGNIYKVARFSEKENCDEYEVWSHVGDAHGYRYHETFYEDGRIYGEYVEPMKESRLQLWLQGHYCEDVNRMLELMTPMIGKIKEFIYVSTNENVFPPYVVFKRITAADIYDIVPTTVDDVKIPQGSCEYFVLSALLPRDVVAVCERERLQGWQLSCSDPAVVDRSFLQSLQLQSNSSKRVEANIVLTWSFEDYDSFKLTEEPKYYIVKGEDKDDRLEI